MAVVVVVSSIVAVVVGFDCCSCCRFARCFFFVFFSVVADAVIAISLRRFSSNSFMAASPFSVGFLLLFPSSSSILFVF